MRLSSLLYTLIFSSITIAPAAASSPDTIPFTLTEHNNLAVHCVLNGTDSLTLMLHTAADAITLTRAATDRLQSLDFSRTDTVGSWGWRQYQPLQPRKQPADRGTSLDGAADLGKPAFRSRHRRQIRLQPLRGTHPGDQL